MTKLIYAACDGKVSDIKALEGSSYWDFCGVLDNYLEKVEMHNKEIEKMKRENNLTSGKNTKKLKSGRK